MSWDRVKGNWKQLKGRVRAGWDKLTDDHRVAFNRRAAMIRTVPVGSNFRGIQS
jgi:hypothetical protein